MGGLILNEYLINRMYGNRINPCASGYGPAVVQNARKFLTQLSNY
jgi:hypothetical protein